MVPGRTRLEPLRDVTLAIVRSATRIENVSACWASANTAMPEYETGAYPVFSSASVYSSGASETKAKCPRASVVVVALCEGLVTVTLTPAIGVAVPVSVTMPLIPPVVPALAGHALDRSAIESRAPGNARGRENLIMTHLRLGIGQQMVRG